jgi:hypothetical protein
MVARAVQYLIEPEACATFMEEYGAYLSEERGDTKGPEIARGNVRYFAANIGGATWDRWRDLCHSS